MSGVIEGNLPYIPTDYVWHPEFLATTFCRELISDKSICVQRGGQGGVSHIPDFAHLCDFEGDGQRCGAGGVGSLRPHFSPRPHLTPGLPCSHPAYPVRPGARNLTKAASHNRAYPLHGPARRPHLSPSPTPYIWVTLRTPGPHRGYPTRGARSPHLSQVPSPHIWPTLRAHHPPPSDPYAT